MIERLKSIHKEILELNIQINSLLNNFPSDNFDNFNEKLQELLNFKDEFIQEILSLKENSEEEFKKIKQTELKEISEQIDNLEKDNLKLILDKKYLLSNKINKTNQAAKALSSYKFNKESEPRIFDETD